MPASGATYQYDANGNLVQKVENGETWTYEWNAEDRLTRVTKDTAEVATFAYDPPGRGVEKLAGGVTTSFTYTGEDILKEARGATLLQYVHGLGIDEPLAVGDGTSLAFFHADALGSVVKRTDAAGTVTFARQYDAWGNLDAGAAEPGYAFTGREWDPEIGLYYYRARTLDPEMGRFLREDPLGQLVVRNLLSYVDSNPVSSRDPSGLLSAKDLVAPWTLGCFKAEQETFGLLRMMTNLEFTSRAYGPGADKVAHCLAHCIIRKGCGPIYGNLYSRLGGAGTEAVDHSIGAVARIAGYPRGWARHRWSWPDYDANEHGRTCPSNVDCPSRCSSAGRTFGSN